MTNEQREAIEYLKESVLIYKNTIPKISDAIDTVLSLLKQKDKQIDLMANSILAREIGKNSCQFNKTCTKFEKGRDIHCKHCIEQYFERKATNNG